MKLVPPPPPPRGKPPGMDSSTWRLGELAREAREARWRNGRPTLTDRLHRMLGLDAP